MLIIVDSFCGICVDFYFLISNVKYEIRINFKMVFGIGYYVII